LLGNRRGTEGRRSGEYRKGERCDDPKLSAASALTLILPFMEERMAYNAYNMRLACCSIQNTTSTTSVVESYLCPSNPRGATKLNPGYYPWESAPTDYALSAGGTALLSSMFPFDVAPSDAGAFGRETPRKTIRKEAYARAGGAFNVNSSTSIRDFRDGVSQSFLTGESAGGAQVLVGEPLDAPEGPSRAGDGARAIDQPWSQGYIGNEKGLGGYGSVFATTAHDAWFTDDRKLLEPNNPTSAWHPNRPVANPRFVRATWLAGEIRTIPADAADPKLPGPIKGASVSPFRGYHQGIVNMGLGDGSVMSVSVAIDPRLWVAMSTIQGGEVFDRPE
jgi:hypothetical protein